MFQYQYQLQYYKSYEPLLPLHHHQMITYPLQYQVCYGGRKTGRVKFFNASKGYGFIIPTSTTKERGKRSSQAAAASTCSNKSVSNDQTSNHDQEDDVAEVFVHQTSIIGSNSKGCAASLYKGEKVEYDLHNGPKGIYALYVTGPKGRPVECHRNPMVTTITTTRHNSRNSHPPSQQQQEYHTKSVFAAYYPHPQQQQQQPPYITYVLPQQQQHNNGNHDLYQYLL